MASIIEQCDRMLRSSRVLVLSRRENEIAIIYGVQSQSCPEVYYRVEDFDGTWTCNCFDFKYRSDDLGPCKHIYAAQRIGRGL